MNRSAVVRTVAALTLVGVAALLVGGCASNGSRVLGFAPASAPASATEIARMTADQKRSVIATSFPIEVPVPQGKVLRGEAQGADLWIYQLEVPAGAADVARWFTSLYPKAEWQLIKDEAAGARRRLVFVKGGYAADMMVTPVGADLTKVTAVVGMGQPVLNTQ
jgi:hypothetical protein